MTTTKAKAVTYKGVPAKVWSYCKGTTRTLGERVEAIEWQTDDVHYVGGSDEPVEHKAGDIELSHCKGDGRTPNFEVFDRLTTSDLYAANAWATSKVG